MMVVYVDVDVDVDVVIVDEHSRLAYVVIKLLQHHTTTQYRTTQNSPTSVFSISLGQAQSSYFFFHHRKCEASTPVSNSQA